MLWLPSVILASCLTVTAAIRAFVTLFVVCLVSRYELAGNFQLPEGISFLTTDLSLQILGTLALVEIISDKHSWLAVRSGSLLAIAKPIVTIIVCIAVLKVGSPMVNCLTALGLGLFLGNPVMRLRSSTSINQHVEPFSTSEMALSLAEDIVASACAIMCFYNPAIVLLCLLALSFILVMRRRQQLDLWAKKVSPNTNANLQQNDGEVLPEGYESREETPEPSTRTHRRL